MQRALIILDTLGSDGSNGIVPCLIFFRRGYENENTYRWYDMAKSLDSSTTINFSIDNNIVTATCSFTYIHATILFL